MPFLHSWGFILSACQSVSKPSIQGSREMSQAAIRQTGSDPGCWVKVLQISRWAALQTCEPLDGAPCSCITCQNATPPESDRLPGLILWAPQARCLRCAIPLETHARILLSSKIKRKTEYNINTTLLYSSLYSSFRCFPIYIYLLTNMYFYYYF